MCTMPSTSLEGVRESLQALQLHEVDFAVGDAFVSGLRDVKVAIEDVSAEAEPWLRAWLDSEYLKGAMLWTGAKTNWKKERAEGPHGPFNIEVRANLVQRFNLWNTTLRDRLTQYERSSRSAADVADWRAELDRLHQDPLAGP